MQVCKIAVSGDKFELLNDLGWIRDTSITHGSEYFSTEIRCLHEFQGLDNWMSKRNVKL